MLPEAVHALIARHEGDVVVCMDNAIRPPNSVSQRQVMAPLQRMSKLRRKNSNKRRGIVLPNRWSTAAPPSIARDSPVPAVAKNRTLHPTQQSSLVASASAPLPLSPLGTLGAEQSSSPSKPIRRSSVKAESIKDYIDPIDIRLREESTASHRELKMPLRRPFTATSSTLSANNLIQSTQRRASTSSTHRNNHALSSSNSVSTALRMPVRRSSFKSSFHRNISCHSYFDDETAIRSSQALSKLDRNSSFEQDHSEKAGELQTSSSPPSQGIFPLQRKSGFEAFRQVLTMPVRRSSLHEESNSEDTPQQTQTHGTSSYESYAQEQVRIRAAAFDAGLCEKEEDVCVRNESFASSNSSLDDIITANESFASSASSSSDSSLEMMRRRSGSFASSDSSFEEADDSTETQSLDLTNNDTSESSSEADATKELLHFEDTTNNDEEDVGNDEHDDEEEEYRKYYTEVETRDVTANTSDNESFTEGPDPSATKAHYVLRRAWKRLSLNHSQPKVDDDVKEIWSKTNSDSGLQRRGSLNHILYTHWKSSHSSDSIQRASPLQRKASRRWSMASTASTLQTASTAASTASSLSAASLLFAPLDHDVHASSSSSSSSPHRQILTMGPSPTRTRKSPKGRWWNPTTRNASMSTTRQRPSAPQL